MKKEWKPEELRQTSEEIRAAVMPKSITPEMVGGTLLALTEAVGEVVETLGEIPREHVKVEVKGCDNEGLIPIDGAVVEVEIFSVQGFPCANLGRMSIPVNDNGEVEFDVPHGFTFSVVSKCEGLAASFQLVQDATRKERVIRLWHFPIGVFWYGQCGMYGDTYYGPSIPFLNGYYTDDTWENDLSWMNEVYEGYEMDEACWRGILIATADTSFVIMPNNLSEASMQWCDTYGLGVDYPFLPNFNPDDMDVEEGDDPWEKARDMSMTDFEGHSNTVKILKHGVSPKAALWCAEKYADWYDQHNYLPSAGQLYIMWLNRTAINAIMNAANDDGWEFALLPYQNEKGSWQNPNGFYEYWWSSTQAGDNCSWVVNYDGHIYRNRSDYHRHVRAVSAFHFEY